MRGKPQAQPDFLTVINLNACVPADHPLRAIKRRVDAVLQKLSPLFDDLYAEEGRGSIPPEQLLKARVVFRGEKRCNDTHQSTSDPASVLYRKAKGKEAKLCFGAHLLMENRHGLCADFSIHNPITEPEPLMALRQLDEHTELHRGTAP